MADERLTRQLDFIAESDREKSIVRNTLLMDASRQETDAEHSWHMAVSALVLKEYLDEADIDMGKVLTMALIHDIVEIDAGDVSVYETADRKERAEKEQLAAERIFGLLPEDQGREFLNIWYEFEKGETPEAKFIMALDGFMPINQNYKTRGLQWRRMNVTRETVLARNRKIERASKRLWEYISTITDDAVKKGYMKP
jgi:putative hydrolases of HD superfamily